LCDDLNCINNGQSIAYDIVRRYCKKALIFKDVRQDKILSDYLAPLLLTLTARINHFFSADLDSVGDLKSLESKVDEHKIKIEELGIKKQSIREDMMPLAAGGAVLASGITYYKLASLILEEADKMKKEGVNDLIFLQNYENFYAKLQENLQYSKQHVLKSMKELLDNSDPDHLRHIIISAVLDKKIDRDWLVKELNFVNEVRKK
jgi:hypothetical protein